jgi:hypothetical protein
MVFFTIALSPYTHRLVLETTTATCTAYLVVLHRRSIRVLRRDSGLLTLPEHSAHQTELLLRELLQAWDIVLIADPVHPRVQQHLGGIALGCYGVVGAVRAREAATAVRAVGAADVVRTKLDLAPPMRTRHVCGNHGWILSGRVGEYSLV